MFIHDIIGIRVRFFCRSLALLFVPLVGVEALDQCSLEYHYLRLGSYVRRYGSLFDVQNCPIYRHALSSTSMGSGERGVFYADPTWTDSRAN